MSFLETSPWTQLVRWFCYTHPYHAECDVIRWKFLSLHYQGSSSWKIESLETNLGKESTCQPLPFPWLRWGPDWRFYLDSSPRVVFCRQTAVGMVSLNLFNNRDVSGFSSVTAPSSLLLCNQSRTKLPYITATFPSSHFCHRKLLSLMHVAITHDDHICFRPNQLFGTNI